MEDGALVVRDDLKWINALKEQIRISCDKCKSNFILFTVFFFKKQFSMFTLCPKLHLPKPVTKPFCIRCKYHFLILFRSDRISKAVKSERSQKMHGGVGG